MNLLSKLVAPIVLSIPLLSGCATYTLSSSSREVLNRREESVDLGTEISLRISPAIASDIVQTDKGETELGIRVTGEQIKQETKRSRNTTFIEQKMVNTYKKLKLDPLTEFIGGVLIIPAIIWATEPSEKVEYGPVEIKVEGPQVLETKLPVGGPDPYIC